MKNFNAEMIEKAKVAKSVEELLEIAKANNIEMTADEAKTYFAQLNPKSGELSDDDLDNVAGGFGCEGSAVNDIGKLVCVTSGEFCSECGNKTGYVTATAHLINILCDKCKTLIATVGECSYEVIG